MSHLLVQSRRAPIRVALAARESLTVAAGQLVTLDAPAWDAAIVWAATGPAPKTLTTNSGGSTR